MGYDILRTILPPFHTMRTKSEKRVDDKFDLFFYKLKCEWEERFMEFCSMYELEECEENWVEWLMRWGGRE